MIDNTMINVESILGLHGHHWLRHTYEKIHHKILTPLLVNKKVRKTMDKSNALVRAANKMAARDALQMSEFTHNLEAWYEANRSRSVSNVSIVDTTGPNGGIQSGQVRKRHHISPPPMPPTEFLNEEFLEEQRRPRASSTFSPVAILKRDDVLPEDEPEYEIEPQRF